MKKRTKGIQYQCRSVQELQEREAEILERVGYSIRYVMGEYEYEGNPYPSVYTFGLHLNQNHPEIECVLPMTQESAMYLLNCLGQRVKKGETFEPYEQYQVPELNHVPFYFIPSVQYGSKIPVLRVILADPNLKLPGDEGCDPIYARQLEIGMNQVAPLIEKYWNDKHSQVN